MYVWLLKIAIPKIATRGRHHHKQKSKTKTQLKIEAPTLLLPHFHPPPVLHLLTIYRPQMKTVPGSLGLRLSWNHFSAVNTCLLMAVIKVQCEIAEIISWWICVTGALSLKAKLGFAARFHGGPPSVASMLDTVFPEAGCIHKGL